MTVNKLQELTQKIYSEGVAKAHQEAEQIIANAKKEADSIIANAKKEADKVLAEANASAEELQKKVSYEVRQAASQTLKTLQQHISSLIVAKMVDEPIKDAFKDKDFVKKIVEAAVKNWADKAEAVTVFLSSNDKELAEYVQVNLSKVLKGGLSVQIDSAIKAGFTIGPADGSYKISFTEEDFQNLLKNYLRPKAAQILYGTNTK